MALYLYKIPSQTKGWKKLHSPASFAPYTRNLNLHDYQFILSPGLKICTRKNLIGKKWKEPDTRELLQNELALSAQSGIVLNLRTWCITNYLQFSAPLKYICTRPMAWSLYLELSNSVQTKAFLKIETYHSIHEQSRKIQKVLKIVSSGLSLKT